MTETVKQDVMLDLETLSSKPDAAIVSIGACTFRTDGGTMAADDRKLFQITIDGHSAQQNGGEIDARTVKWWLGQSNEARAAVTAGTPAHIAVALGSFRTFLLELNEPRIWGNGAGFDNVVLRRSFERQHLEAPWGFYADRCYRTLKNLAPQIGFARIGTAHSALDDALSQAVHAERIFAALKVSNAGESA